MGRKLDLRSGDLRLHSDVRVKGNIAVLCACVDGTRRATETLAYI
jgi:hypothetical protein